MNCQEFQERLVDYLEGPTDEGPVQAMREHADACESCRADLQGFESLHERLTLGGKAFAQKRLDNMVMDRIVREQNFILRKVLRSRQTSQKWRTIMHSRITKLTVAAAASLAIIVGGAVFWGGSASTAYAIAQTIEANHTVRFLHVTDRDATHEEPKEFWVEFDEFGQVKNVRIHMPEWDSPSDGAKAIVWNSDTVRIWFKKKNGYFIARDKTVADKMLGLVEGCDPRQAVKRLEAKAAQGEVELQIEEPASKDELIIVTATYLPGSKGEGRREILFVDQATKLVVERESYRWVDGEYKYLGMQEYLDYNQPISSDMFALDEEVPDDVMRIDQTVQEIGLEQGDLSDEVIATEVVRQAFEALIAENYAEAGRLIEGLPAERVREIFGGMRFIRIVSVGPVGPHPNPGTRGLLVPCTVEIEKNGAKSEQAFSRLGVRQVFNQPGRWTIFGGL